MGHSNPKIKKSYSTGLYSTLRGCTVEYSIRVFRFSTVSHAHKIDCNFDQSH